VSTYSLALPELERIGATGTTFVISDLVGKKWEDQPVMSERMLQSLSSRGWEIGSHTRTHPNLTELSDSQINAELRDSKERLEAITHTEVASLSYPFNEQNNRIRAIAARYYKFARWDRSYPPLRVNSVFPPDKMKVNSVATYDNFIVLPVRLLAYLVKRIGYRPRGITKPSSFKGLDARIVRKWLRSLRKDQWLVLSFHDIHTDKPPNVYSIDLEEFREIVKVVDELAEVVNFGMAART
jgi:peptidoglycan/xylan/chitin deacetylase (PgdA/CDA1 family)